MTEASVTAKQEQTVDAFLGGLVTLVQPRKGHRAGLDAALLQALVPSDAAGLAVDLGAGVGTVALSVAARVSTLSIVGVERDAALVALGLQALALPQNARFARRVRLVAADVSPPRDLAARLAIGGRTADFVLMNPPFDQEGRGTQSPDARRREAHVAAAGLLKSWTASAVALLAPGGRLAFIHRADALAEVFDVLSDGFGGVRVWPLYPSEGAPASRILVSARRGSRAPLSILPGLVLHQANGAWTQRADDLLRGKAELTA